jgi:hypothetical protein
MNRGALTVAFAALFASGCSGSGSSLKVVPVKGKVTYRGQPLVGASVSFNPVDRTNGRVAGGQTDANGNYTLATLEGGTKIAQGALLGDYKVIVVKTKKSPDAEFAERINTMTPEELQKLPPADKERMAKLGGGAVDPRQQQGNAQPDSEIPTRYNMPDESKLIATVKEGNSDPINFDLTD